MDGVRVLLNIDRDIGGGSSALPIPLSHCASIKCGTGENDRHDTDNPVAHFSNPRAIPTPMESEPNIVCFPSEKLTAMEETAECHQATFGKCSELVNVISTTSIGENSNSNNNRSRNTMNDGNLSQDSDSGTEEDDGHDPWGEGPGEAAWGSCNDERKLALVEALGSWCASLSAYDRIARPAPGSATGRAAATEAEWKDLERRIARGRLDLQLEEFR